MRRDGRNEARQAGGMDNDTRLHRATLVFLARLLMVYDSGAGDILRRMADELDCLADELARDEWPGGRPLNPDG